MRYGPSVPDVFDQHVAIKLADIVWIKVVLRVALGKDLALNESQRKKAQSWV